MPGKLQLLARDLLPPLIARPLARRFLDVRYTGRYRSWSEAARDAGGYDAPNILEQVTASARAVRDGRAAYERDGVVFCEPDYRWPLLACLLREALRNKGRLRVLDFGGSLGSTYFQHRAVLSAAKELRWGVVEQPAFVETGRREFINGELSFHLTVDDAMRTLRPNVVLFSGVLAWIENPHAVLDQILSHESPAVLVDRTPLTSLDHDVAKLQRVPDKIYRASYPCWFLSRARFLDHFADRYSLNAEFPQLDAHVPGTNFGGFHFERKHPGALEP